MTLLPVIERELAVRSRHPLTYWGRGMIALVAMLISLPVLFGNDPRLSPTDLGRTAFHALVWTAVVLSFEAAFRAAEATWAERREQTLELLLLTGLKARDVVFGKVVSCGLSSLAGLSACLPLMVLPLLGGGVTAGEVARQGLALFATLLFSLSLGALAGASTTSRRGPLRQTIALGSIFVLLPLLIQGLLSAMRGPSWLMPGLMSPILLTVNASAKAYAAGTAPFWISLGVIVALALILLLRAGVDLRLESDDSGISSGTAPSPRLSSPEAWSWNQRISPITWTVRQTAGIRLAGWTAGLLSAAAQMGIFTFLAMTGIRFGFFRWTNLPGMVVSALTTALVAWGASRFFVESRRTGELELLMTTPLGAERIMADQWIAVRGMLLGPGLLVLVPFFLSLAMIGPRGFGNSYYTISLVFSVVNILLRFYAACWLGMWFGYRNKGQARAVLLTTAWLWGIPAVLRITTLGMLPLFAWFWSLPATVYYLIAANWAKHSLAEALPRAGAGSGDPFSEVPAPNFAQEAQARG